MSGPPDGRRRLIYLVWNTLGLADIVLVLVTATRIALTAPTSLTPLSRLPLSTVPTFIVPVIIATHVLVFLKLGRWAPATYTVNER